MFLWVDQLTIAYCKLWNCQNYSEKNRLTTNNFHVLKQLWSYNLIKISKQKKLLDAGIWYTKKHKTRGKQWLSHPKEWQILGVTSNNRWSKCGYQILGNQNWIIFIGSPKLGYLNWVTQSLVMKLLELQRYKSSNN